jgi:CRISPR system Cascade subunit CasC
MFVELHILQNFAPSNLNRDDTGAPKDCEFGGYRRARISSQCLKRAIRTEFRSRRLLPSDVLATRTKRIHEAVAERLEGYHRRDQEEAESAVRALLGGVKIGFNEQGEKTQYLLYVGEREIQAIADLVQQNWDVLAAVRPPAAAEGQGRRGAKKAASESVPAQLGGALKATLRGGKAADLALFGRMLADLPERNIDAASQVAHAISTHQVSMEFDFYAAVDDRRPEDTEGADMLGTIEFNSACFYRYANVDLAQLVRNLEGDEALARQTLEAFIRASVAAIPIAKQHSMAAYNPPALVFAVAREHSLWSLANAFLEPVRPSREQGDLMVLSTKALDRYWGQLIGMYGKDGIVGTWLATLDGDQHLEHLHPLVSRTSKPSSRVPSPRPHSANHEHPVVAPCRTDAVVGYPEPLQRPRRRQ